MFRKFSRIAFLSLAFAGFLGGCALNEIARKEDITVAKTDLADEILKTRNENRVLSERLDATTRRVEELITQIDAAKTQSLDSIKFIEQKLEQLNAALAEAKAETQKSRENISSEFSGKIQVVLDEVSKENAKLHQKIDAMGEAKKPARPAGRRASSNSASAGQSTYTVAPGDTLAKIAKHHGVSVAALLELNPAENPNSLKAGQRLVLPAGAQASQ